MVTTNSQIFTSNNELNFYELLISFVLFFSTFVVSGLPLTNTDHNWLLLFSYITVCLCSVCTLINFCLTCTLIYQEHHILGLNDTLSCGGWPIITQSSFNCEVYENVIVLAWVCRLLSFNNLTTNFHLATCIDCSLWYTFSSFNYVVLI